MITRPFRSSYNRSEGAGERMGRLRGEALDRHACRAAVQLSLAVRVVVPRKEHEPVFAVRYTWPGGEANSVASGPDRETALANFQRENPHVTVVQEPEGAR